MPCWTALACCGPAPGGRTSWVKYGPSCSSVLGYIRCLHQYRFRNLRGFEPELHPDLGFGRSVHHVLRAVAERVRKTGESPVAMLEQVPHGNGGTDGVQARRARARLNLRKGRPAGRRLRRIPSDWSSKQGTMTTAFWPRRASTCRLYVLGLRE